MAQYMTFCDPKSFLLVSPLTPVCRPFAISGGLLPRNFGSQSGGLGTVGGTLAAAKVGKMAAPGRISTAYSPLPARLLRALCCANRRF
jgi:hypothetical protein